MTKLGKYEIIEEIGRGGFAVVYQARDTDLDRVVALKVLHPYWTADASFVARFRREARSAARLRHPNIVTVHEAGEFEGQLYIAMEYVPGRTLRALLEEEAPLSLEQALPILEQTAEALDHAHAQGVVHRDVKPSNVMVEETERGVRATLMDFGLVKAMAGSSVLTSHGTLLGSPEYMAPEQADPERAAEIGPATDRYALGIVAYQMLTGRVPFPGNTPATLNAHLNLAPPAPQVVREDLPPDVAASLLKMLAKSPGDRFASAGAFVARLREAQSGETQRREREAQLAPLYERLQAAAAREDWAEVLTLGGQIRGLDADYRNVLDVMEQAKTQMRPPRRRRLRETRPEGEARTALPSWVWIAGGALAVALVVGLAGWRLGWFGPDRPPASASLHDTWTRPIDGMVMVYVPGGTFQMGSDEADPGAEDNEFPQHSVTLDGFWIDRTEVTNAQYRQCVEAGACQAPTTCDWGKPTYRDAAKTDHPVVCVDWSGAAAYCAWAEARLPTEAEWEYAARGPDGLIYPWGNSPPDNTLLNYDRNVSATTGVGAYPDGASWCGALDMAGNVSEWAADWYGDYPLEAQANPAGPEAGVLLLKVLRGGGWYSFQESVRAANRGMVTPDYRNDSVGFRCAGQPGEPAEELISEAPAASAILDDTWPRPADGMMMVYVPGGTFQMGSDRGDPDAEADEFPQHSVTLDGFWIDQTEVTKAQFAAFLSDQGNQTVRGLTWLDLEYENCLIEQSGGEFRPKSGYGDRPVVVVSWYGAKAYCEWVGARLPTEAEWEYAARGPDNFTYPWGNSPPDSTLLNYDRNTRGQEEVGSYPGGASWCGALDLAGNVWEWVADWYDDYPSEAQINPTGPETGYNKVMRGGSSVSPQGWVRAAYRYADTPDDRYLGVGSRCVRPAGE